MRKRSIVFLILAILIISSSIGHASEYGFINIEMDGKKQKVREVPIIMNGQVVKSDSPSFLNVDRTLVPVRLVAENYGAKVDWERETRTAIIDHNGEIIRLTIDSQIAVVNGKAKQLDKTSIPKLVKFGSGDAKTMVPFSFIADILGYETDWDNVKKAAYLKKKTTDVKPEIIVPDKDDSSLELEDKKPEKPAKYKIGKILTSTSNQPAIVVTGGAKAKRNIMQLSNPNRLVIDLMDSELKGSIYEEYNYKIGPIEKVRVSKFQPDNNYSKNDKIVRVVLDLTEGTSRDDIKLKSSGNDLIIEPEINAWDDIYIDSDKRILNIKTLKKTSYDVSYDHTKKIMTLELAGDALDLVSGSKEVMDSFVSEIKVDKSGGKLKVHILFRRGISYNILSSGTTDHIQIGYVRDKNIKNSDRIIVIDPGHGGKDPGTSSSSGTREKDVVLDTSLLVRDGLEAKGYNVLMTRDSDIYPSLDDRANFANNNYADIFISVHANSAASSASGIETFVPRSGIDAMKKEQGRELANLIQEELIKETKARNRGVKEANHAVTRKSHMPAVLVELGFLTNPIEATSLTHPAYQEKLAKAIVKGIERYFEIY